LFGNPRVINSKTSGPSLLAKTPLRSAGYCADNVTAKDAKHTKRNPRRPWSHAESPQKTTKETKMQTAPSFSLFPSVQNLRDLTPNVTAQTPPDE
jgi:hypothetical protein